jgi:hypothetical protein
VITPQPKPRSTIDGGRSTKPGTEALSVFPADCSVADAVAAPARSTVVGTSISSWPVVLETGTVAFVLPTDTVTVPVKGAA